MTIKSWRVKNLNTSALSQKIYNFQENRKFNISICFEYFWLFWAIYQVNFEFWSKVIFFYWFASHHDIITQPQLLSCYIINFNDHISSCFLQTTAHFIHFLYHSLSHSDLLYFVTLMSDRHSILLLFLLSTNLHSGN